MTTEDLIADLKKKVEQLEKENEFLETFLKMLQRPEKEFIAYTETLDEHPEIWNSYCHCRLCLSYD